MHSFVPVASSPGCAAWHYRMTFGKFRGRMLGALPGWYMKFLLLQLNLERELREKLFETLTESADRRYALDQVTAEVDKL